jgi:4-methyl-5(b-hydroxyethyl)-thiazole monophosphate biosynthesis
VADCNILTSRGSGTTVEFGLLMVEKLFGPEKARSIADAVCA